MSEQKSDDLAWMTLRVGLLYRQDARGRLLTINEPCGGGIAPRFYMGRCNAGAVWRFRADLPEHLADALATLCAREPITDDLRTAPLYLPAYLELLGATAYQGGPAYQFTNIAPPVYAAREVTQENESLLDGGFDAFKDELAHWQPYFAVVEEGRAVSVCRSVRISAHGHEAGVETLAAHRGKGYARDAVAAWAGAVRALGVEPAYSTSWNNIASRSLAKKLGLRMAGAGFHID